MESKAGRGVNDMAYNILCDGELGFAFVEIDASIPVKNRGVQVDGSTVHRVSKVGGTQSSRIPGLTAYRTSIV